MKDDIILRVIAKLTIPFMLVFALYVQFHGDYGPGGGFQAGVIAATAIVFYAVIFGLANTFLRPILRILTLPITIMTLGLVAPSGRPDLVELRRLARRQVSIGLERLPGVAMADPHGAGRILDYQRCRHVLRNGRR